MRQKLRWRGDFWTTLYQVTWLVLKGQLEEFSTMRVKWSEVVGDLYLEDAFQFVSLAETVYSFHLTHQTQNKSVQSQQIFHLLFLDDNSIIR